MGEGLYTYNGVSRARVSTLARGWRPRRGTRAPAPFPDRGTARASWYGRGLNCRTGPPESSEVPPVATNSHEYAPSPRWSFSTPNSLACPASKLDPSPPASDRGPSHRCRRRTGGSLRCPARSGLLPVPLVVVLVTVQDDIGPRNRQVVPERARSGRRRVAVCRPRVEQRMVPEGEDARLRRAHQVALEEAVLR